MPNLREIPVTYIVDKAVAQPTAKAASPYRSLIKDWFDDNKQETMGYTDLTEIDNHFKKKSTVKKELELESIVFSNIRNDALKTNMLISIIREIYRRMTIPKKKSRKAEQAEDIRQDNWSWPLVMRVMIKENIILPDTNKTNFGALIEKITGAKPNSIRRKNYGDFILAENLKKELSTSERDAYQEIFKLFIPLIKPKS